MLKRKHWILFSIIAAITAGALCLLFIRSGTTRPGVFIKRAEIILLIAVFLSGYCFVDFHAYHDWLYKYRLIICLCLLVFCVLNKFSGSSVGFWNTYIQPGKGSEYVSPVFGASRAIRSDEWMGSVPRTITGCLSHFEKYNDIMMATRTSNLASSELYLDYGALAVPPKYGYYLFGAEYGLSFSWSYLMIFGALFSFELCMILTDQDRLLSLLGMSLIWFSPFNLWWSTCTQLFCFCAIVVLFYYFVKAESHIRRLIFGIMLAIAGSHFIVNLYPAWQVPFGWVMVCLLIWILITNRDWQKFTGADWIIFVVSLLFMASVTGRYLYNLKDYINATGTTVYPGKRVNYGGFALDRTLGYIAETIESINFTGTVMNTSEYGCFFAAFPLGVVLGIIQLIRNKGRQSLLIALLIPGIILLCYCTFPLNPYLCRILMLTSSMPVRAVGVLEFVSVLLLIAAMADMKKTGRLHPVWGFLISLGCIFPAITYSYSILKVNHVESFWVIGILAMIGAFLMISEVKQKLVKEAIMFTAVCLFGAGMCINPIQVGLDAITTKPLYSEVTSIVNKEPDARWIALENQMYPQYLIACGAHTINSVNYLPNHALWKKIDPDNKYEDIWNRYGHFIIHLSDNNRLSMNLQASDTYVLNVDHRTLDLMKVDYILTPSEIDNPEWSSRVKKVYSEDGMIIYRVKRKS